MLAVISDGRIVVVGCWCKWRAEKVSPPVEPEPDTIPCGAEDDHQFEGGKRVQSQLNLVVGVIPNSLKK